MSQENVEIVRRALEAASRLFVDAAFYAPDLVYRPIASFTESAECRGVDELRRFAERFSEAWADDFTINGTSIRDYGDAVISRIEFSGHARASGIEITDRMFKIFWLRDGLIFRIEDFTTREEALNAVGLEE
jgi:ketosteroid isomerase-like protein